MSDRLAPRFKLGDRVSVNPEYAAPREDATRVFTVSKVNPKNLTMTPDDGQGPPVVAPPYAMVPATAENIAKIVRIDPTPIGTVVRIKNVRNIDPDTLYVVLSDMSGQLKITRLGGGDEGRFFSKIPQKYAVRVELPLAGLSAMLDN